MRRRGAFGDKGAFFDENLEETSELSDSDYLKGYPRGSKLGLALHSIFEKIDFETALPIASASSGKRISDYEELCTDSDVKTLIEDSFSEQGLKIDEKDSKNWRKNTAQIVWNALSARFKELTEGKDGEAFYGENLQMHQLWCVDYLLPC